MIYKHDPQQWFVVQDFLSRFQLSFDNSQRNSVLGEGFHSLFPLDLGHRWCFVREIELYRTETSSIVLVKYTVPQIQYMLVNGVHDLEG